MIPALDEYYLTKVAPPCDHGPMHTLDRCLFLMTLPHRASATGLPHGYGAATLATLRARGFIHPDSTIAPAGLERVVWLRANPTIPDWRKHTSARRARRP